MGSGLSSRWWWGGLAGLLLLLSAQVAAAQPRSAREGSREPGRDPDREQEAPGVFDYYLMSFTIAPSFCAQSPRYAEKRECQDGTDAAYRETPLTVHGLWPNRERVSVNLQPQYCAAEPLAGVSAPVAKALRRYMPGTADGLSTAMNGAGTAPAQACRRMPTSVLSSASPSAPMPRSARRSAKAGCLDGRCGSTSC